MKPTITKIAGIPSTGVICCSQCFRLISYEAGRSPVTCHACGTTVKRQDLPMSIESALLSD